MILPDARKITEIIVKRMRPDGITEDMPEENDNAEEQKNFALRSACEDMIKAFNANDADMLKRSLMVFIEISMDDSESEPQHEE